MAHEILENFRAYRAFASRRIECAISCRMLYRLTGFLDFRAPVLLPVQYCTIGGGTSVQQSTAKGQILAPVLQFSLLDNWYNS